MIAHSDDGPEFDPDDPLAVILRPVPGHLGPPPGRFEAIRRRAARRRLLRGAAGVGAACAAAALIALPVYLAAPGFREPARPTAPLAPPPPVTTPPPAEPSPSASPESSDSRRAETPRERRSVPPPATPRPDSTAGERQESERSRIEERGRPSAVPETTARTGVTREADPEDTQRSR